MATRLWPTLYSMQYTATTSPAAWVCIVFTADQRLGTNCHTIELTENDPSFPFPPHFNRRVFTWAVSRTDMACRQRDVWWTNRSSWSVAVRSKYNKAQMRVIAASPSARVEKVPEHNFGHFRPSMVPTHLWSENTDTHRNTQRETTLHQDVCSNMPHLASAAMRPEN